MMYGSGPNYKFHSRRSPSPTADGMGRTFSPVSHPSQSANIQNASPPSMSAIPSTWPHPPPNLTKSTTQFFHPKVFPGIHSGPFPTSPFPPEEMDHMLEAYFRSDMLSLCNNPYLFPRPCSVADWMSMQHMYSSYMNFLNHIGECPTSATPPASSITQTQSVQTQTPVHEFKSTMIQTDGSQIFMSTGTDCQESSPSPDAKNVAASSSPQVEKPQRIQQLEDLPQKRGAGDATTTTPQAKETNDNQEKENNVPLAKETCGSRPAFLPVPRSRGRGRKSASNDKSYAEPFPGLANDTQNISHIEGIPGSASPTPRSRGRGHPNLKLIMPHEAKSQNVNNNAQDLSNAAVQLQGIQGEPSVVSSSTPNKNGVEPTNKRKINSNGSPTVSVPPGFEGKPVSPPLGLCFSMPLSPIQLLPVQANRPMSQCSVNKSLFQEEGSVSPEIASDVNEKPWVKTPPGLVKQSLPPVTVGNEASTNTKTDASDSKESASGRSSPDQMRDKLRLPVFSKMYKSKKTSIQNYLRASLADNKRRRRGAVLTRLERIEEKNDEEDLTLDEDHDEQSKKIPKDGGGKASVKSLPIVCQLEIACIT